MICPPTLENISAAAESIRRGHLIAFPTETVYGLGADATNSAAVQKIFDAKNRPTLNPLIVHVPAWEEIEQVADISAPRLRANLEAVKQFWPGPISVVVPKGKVISSRACAGLASVAVRIPNHPVALGFLRSCGTPVAAPSANISSYVSPTTAAHVEKELGHAVDMVLDGGPCSVGVESTIISLLEADPVLLRPGGVSLEMLQQVFPRITVATHTHAGGAQPLSPGLLREHYAPHTPIALRNSLSIAQYPARVGLIAFSKPDDLQAKFAYSAVSVLSTDQNLNEIAAKLFAAIREQDELGLDLIVVDSCSEIGLGRAIMDRLLRATAKFDL